MNNDIIFRISEVDDHSSIFHSDDDRIEDRDNDIVVSTSKVDNMKAAITAVLEDEGYSVSFEVD